MLNEKNAIITFAVDFLIVRPFLPSLRKFSALFIAFFVPRSSNIVSSSNERLAFFSPGHT
jgi:hypothetical protein